MPRKVHRMADGAVIPYQKWYAVQLHDDGTATVLGGPMEHAEARSIIDDPERAREFGVLLTQEELDRIQDRLRMQEGAAVVEDVPEGVPAIIGEAGPEAVIPLDDPAAVEVMAEAIEEGGGGESSDVEAAAEAVEAAAEATEAAADAVAVSAVADAVADVAEADAEAVEAVADAEAEAVEELADATTEVAEAEADATEAEAEAVEELAETPDVDVASLDTSPEETHWFFRKLVRR